MKDILGTFRLDYEYDIEYEYDFSILVFRLHISSHELQFLPKTNVKNKGSGNVTGLKLKTHTRTQSRTRSPIWRSLFSNRGLRCPQGPDLADCQNLQGILEKCFIRHLRRWRRSSLKTVCFILHRISAFQVSRHYKWNENSKSSDSRHAWLWQPQTKLYCSMCTEGISLFFSNVYRIPKSPHRTKNKQDGPGVASWSCKAQGRTY